MCHIPGLLVPSQPLRPPSSCRVCWRLRGVSREWGCSRCPHRCPVPRRTLPSLSAGGTADVPQDGTGSLQHLQSSFPRTAASVELPHRTLRNRRAPRSQPRSSSVLSGLRPQPPLCPPQQERPCLVLAHAWLRGHPCVHLNALCTAHDHQRPRPACPGPQCLFGSHVVSTPAINRTSAVTAKPGVLRAAEAGPRLAGLVLGSSMLSFLSLSPWPVATTLCRPWA